MVEADTWIRAWMENFAAKCDTDYDGLMAAAKKWVEHSDYSYDNSEGYQEIPQGDWDTFWAYYQHVTGVPLPSTGRELFFITCSC